MPHEDSRPTELDLGFQGQVPSVRPRIDVAAHRRDRRQGAKAIEDSLTADVARMYDVVHSPKQLEQPRMQPAVGVRDHPYAAGTALTRRLDCSWH
jgi:hypothetical protein